MSGQRFRRDGQDSDSGDDYPVRQNSRTPKPRQLDSDEDDVAPVRNSLRTRAYREDTNENVANNAKSRFDDDEEVEVSVIRKRNNANGIRRSGSTNAEGFKKSSWEFSHEKPASNFTPKEVPKPEAKEAAIDYMKKFNGQAKKNIWVNGGQRSSRSSFQDDDPYKSEVKNGDGQRETNNNGKWNTAAKNSTQSQAKSTNDEYFGGAEPRDSAEFNDDNEFVDDDIISNPKIADNTNTTFAEYADEAEKNGQTLPRRSGRYDDDNAKSLPAAEDNFLPRSLLPSQAIANSISSISLSKSFVHIAHRRGTRTDQVQCVIVRDRSSMSSKLYPAYTLILEETKKPLIIAKKMNMNRTSNYHLFDMTRGQPGSKLTKKSGNYLGKLRSKNVQSTEYVLVGQNSEREEFAGVMFDRLSIVTQMKEGSQPRKMTLVVPELGEDDTPIAHRVYDEDSDGMSEMLKQRDLSLLKGVHVLESKEPVYENGNYRLNFHGRVSIPSVKNFQLVSPNDIDDIVCQFGKVGEDKFHLDYKAPLNAFQAFSLALCQFNV